MADKRSNAVNGKRNRFWQACHETGYKPYVAPRHISVELDLEEILRLPTDMKEYEDTFSDVGTVYDHAGVFGSIFKLLDGDKTQPVSSVKRDMKILRWSISVNEVANLEREYLKAETKEEKDQVRNKALKFMYDNKFITFKNDNYEKSVELGIVENRLTHTQEEELE